MIQRIQTIYLIIVTALMAGTVFSPLAKVFSGGEVFKFMAFGLQQLGPDGAGIKPYIVSTPYLGILLAICTVVPLAAIFMFKNRWLQMRFCIVQMVLLGGAQVMIVHYLMKVRALEALLSQGGISHRITDIIPLLCLVFMWLAIRGIIRDETLVKSLNRIR